MTNWKSDFGKINKTELKKSLRDSAITLAGAFIVALIGVIDGFDYTVFGDLETVAYAIGTSILVPLINRATNLLRVK